MYYKVKLRILGKYYNDGYVNIEKDKFEGFLTLDYISGSVKKKENSRNKILHVKVIRKKRGEDSSVELPNLSLKFEIYEFTIPEVYEAPISVYLFQDYDNIDILDTMLELEFTEKVDNLPDFEKNLKEVKESLKL